MKETILLKSLVPLIQVDEDGVPDYKPMKIRARKSGGKTSFISSYVKLFLCVSKRTYKSNRCCLKFGY